MTAARKISAPNGRERFACSTCGLSKSHRHAANSCCGGKVVYANFTKPLPGHRTQDQIVADCEARMAELEQQAAAPIKKFPCSTCRWKDTFYDHKCLHPLIIGLESEALPNVEWQIEKCGGMAPNWPTVKLCGPEKALWEPKPESVSRWKIFAVWFVSLFVPHDLSPGFHPISGKRSPPRDGTRWHIQLRCGFIDTRASYTADQLVWVHNGGAGDVVAVRRAE